MVVMLVGLNLYKVSLELSSRSIIFGGKIESNIDNIGSSPKGGNFFFKSFHFFVLLSLLIDKCLEPRDFSDQLLKLLGIYFVVVISVV